MARAGNCNFRHSSDDPVKADRCWVETMARGGRDHRYSVFNDPPPKASYAYMNTTSNDFLTRTWQVADHVPSVAAGKVSFHHNIAKPSGVMRMHAASGSFERPRINHPLTQTGMGVLSNSSSAPNLQPPGRTGYRFDDRPMTGMSVASSRPRPHTGASGRSGRSQQHY
mmetsp:Transcript_28631/g.85175  ORF Transcript_28631/g.85175 Transcript_28631/m.85175 type:complete len:168 (-) Transcript_28631:91-594(-)